MKFLAFYRNLPIFFLLQEELYSKICGLSYMGDLRMLFAEDKNKVNSWGPLTSTLIPCRESSARADESI